MKNLRILASLSLSLVTCLWLQSCGNKPPEASIQSADKLQGKLVLTGSSTVAPPLLPSLVVNSNACALPVLYFSVET